MFRHMSIECDRGCEGDEDDDDSDSDETTSSATSSEDFDNSEGDNSSWAPGEDLQTNSTEFSSFTEEMIRCGISVFFKNYSKNILYNVFVSIYILYFLPQFYWSFQVSEKLLCGISVVR